jgi:hypothetical protein
MSNFNNINDDIHKEEVYGGADNNEEEPFLPTAYSHIRVASTGNRVLLPKEILYSDFYHRVGYYYHDDDNNFNDTKPKNNSEMNPLTQGLPLPRAIEDITNSLKRIIQTIKNGVRFSSTKDGFAVDPSLLQQLDILFASHSKSMSHPSSLWSHSSSSSSTGNSHRSRTSSSSVHGNESIDPFYIIRIEQPLSHPVDPLCLLHSNIPSSTIIHNAPNGEQNPPIFYLANAEGNDEVAAYGSSITLHSLSSSSSSFNRQQKQEGKEEDHLDAEQFTKLKNNSSSWKIIENLPWGSKVYGGSRFDNSFNTT